MPGLASFGSRPFEYWVLQSKPQPWSAEDSVLCVHAMFLQLQDSGGTAAAARLAAGDAAPRDVAIPRGGAPEWDAADRRAAARDEPRIPSADEYDLRKLKGFAGSATAGSHRRTRSSRQQQLGDRRIAHRERRRDSRK